MWENEKNARTLKNYGIVNRVFAVLFRPYLSKQSMYSFHFVLKARPNIGIVRCEVIFDFIKRKWKKYSRQIWRILDFCVLPFSVDCKSKFWNLRKTQSFNVAQSGINDNEIRMKCKVFAKYEEFCFYVFYYLALIQSKILNS